MRPNAMIRVRPCRAIVRNQVPLTSLCGTSRVLAALSHVTACVGGDEAVRPLMNGPGDPQPRVGAKLLQQRGRFRKPLELERLLRPFRHPKRRPSPIVARIDIGPLLDEILDDLVEPSERGAMQRGEIAMVCRVYVGPGFDQGSGPLPPPAATGRPAASRADTNAGRAQRPSSGVLSPHRW